MVLSKLLSISLSLIILTQSFGIVLDDVLQLDEFIEHAQFHNEQYGDNVIVFISKHYGELKANHEKEHQEEKEEHEQLPFNHNNCSHITTVTAFVLHALKEEQKIPRFAESIDSNFFYQAPTSSLHKSGLFQPPRNS